MESYQTEFVDVPGGRIAYDVTGQGSLVVLSPGMVDIRSSYRFLAPLLVSAGYRVARVDLRGHGDSSTGWPSYSHPDTAGDLIAVIRSLGGPAVLVGQSFSGGAATIAAATNPDAVSALVEIGPFTRPPEISVGALVQNAEYRHGAFLLGEFALTGHIKAWVKYLGVAYPGRKPADWDAYLAAVEASLNQPARLDAARKTFSSAGTLKVAAAQLANVKCPVLVVIGRDDSDFPNSETEAQGIIGMLPPGVGSYRMIDSAGHYPHAQYPQQVADAILAFLGKGRAA